jgi:hypothetical protein
LNPNFRDMLCALYDENVEFLVVGAYALSAHGLPRATGDLDIWVRPTAENAGRIWRALDRFCAPLSKLRVEDFCDPDLVFQIGVAPYRIDLLTSITGVSFEEAWQARIFFQVDGRAIGVLSRDDLLRNKRSTARPKDLADAAWLEEICRDEG